MDAGEINKSPEKNMGYQFQMIKEASKRVLPRDFPLLDERKLLESFDLLIPTFPQSTHHHSNNSRTPTTRSNGRKSTGKTEKPSTTEAALIWRVSRDI
jgi:hypothetical protein